ncbi:MAG: glutathione S-transferase family protein [Gammaproteobacteria bacterium]|nr:MAG: glutathione S-transferase family protein [Gammaproteobacteria bacterium]
MKLYYFETPHPRIACAVAKHTDAPVEWVRIDLTRGENKRPEYLAIDPNGKVPALVDGDVTLWEAPAVICHLAAKTGSDLWPQDERARIDILRWFNWSTAHFSRHAGTIFFERVIKPGLRLGEPDAHNIEQSSAMLRPFAGVLDAHLAQRDYLVGNRLSLADFHAAMFLGYDAAQLPLEEFGHIARWYARLHELPAWREPFPAQA